MSQQLPFGLDMRILVVSTLYPPVAFGGYEVECSAVVERLRQSHDVLVLTSDLDRAGTAEQAGVRRELVQLTPDARGGLRAPFVAPRAARSAHGALAWDPELIYVWNGSLIPQTALRMLADSGVPLAFRVCEHWFGSIFHDDQFLRELMPARRSPPRAAWAAACRAINLLPSLRLHPTAPLRAGISWNSEAIKRMVNTPRFVEPVLERICHSVPRFGDVYAEAVRDPAPEPEIVFLGRVTPYKGVAVAIEALALLRSTHGIVARLVVIGPEDADHGIEMRRLAERLGVAGEVDWRGQVSSEQAAVALGRAHALIVPSTWNEPFPLVTIEGALARVPLVASDVGGIGEGMHHEEHALLFGRGDAVGAAEALVRTLVEREQTASRVARALERAQAYRLGPYLDSQERFVDEVLAEWGRDGAGGARELTGREGAGEARGS
ncbi:MAG TPA: glycosyltransferase [Solirubrobacteraceae bacterium]|jgi:glycosyltransferase involved in cell wall biosynthesis